MCTHCWTHKRFLACWSIKLRREQKGGEKPFSFILAPTCLLLRQCWTLKTIPNLAARLHLGRIGECVPWEVGLGGKELFWESGPTPVSNFWSGPCAARGINGSVSCGMWGNLFCQSGLTLVSNFWSGPCAARDRGSVARGRWGWRRKELFWESGLTPVSNFWSGPCAARDHESCDGYSEDACQSEWLIKNCKRKCGLCQGMKVHCNPQSPSLARVD